MTETEGQDMGVKLSEMNPPDGKTMGGKPPEYWDSSIRRIVKLIATLDLTRNNALRMEDPSGEEVAQEAAGDIDALIDALVVLDYEYQRHFGERPPCLGPKRDRAPVQ